MINEKLRTALNTQLNRELFSSYLYLSMSAYLSSINMTGSAHWMRVQAQEEIGHAMRIYDYIIERGGRVVLTAVEAPAEKWDSVRNAFEAAYAHERGITERIGELADLAASENDHATSIFLQWFVNEQVEEEASTSAIVEQLKLVGDATGGLFMIDRALGERKAG